MLVFLTQASHSYRAHIACGVLREHGVEAHVFHENSDILHGGASTTTASLWVREDEWQDACEILGAAPLEPLPEGDLANSMNVPRVLFPPMEAVALGVAASIFAGSAMVIFTAMVPILTTLDPDVIFQAFLGFLLALLIEALTALGMGLAVGILSTISFPVIRWYQAKWWPAVALMSLLGWITAISVAMSLVN